MSSKSILVISSWIELDHFLRHSVVQRREHNKSSVPNSLQYFFNLLLIKVIKEEEEPAVHVTIKAIAPDHYISFSKSPYDRPMSFLTIGLLAYWEH